MSTLLVVADRIVTGFDSDGRPEILIDAGILVERGVIVAVGPSAALRRDHPDAREIGGRGRVAIPGLVNAHHHVGLTPFQLGARDQPLELWFPERLVMRDIDPRLDTLYSAFEMIASGRNNGPASSQPGAGVTAKRFLPAPMGSSARMWSSACGRPIPSRSATRIG